jgi:hypothetical protein
MRSREAKRRVAGMGVLDTRRWSETEGVKRVKFSKKDSRPLFLRGYFRKVKSSPGNRTVVIMKNGMQI